MKKNVVGHMLAQKESAVKRLRRLQVLPRLFCLILALVLWLLIVNLNPTDKAPDPGPTTEQSA